MFARERINKEHIRVQNEARKKAEKEAKDYEDEYREIRDKLMMEE